MTEPAWTVWIVAADPQDRSQARRALREGSSRSYRFRELDSAREFSAAWPSDQAIPPTCLLLDAQLPDADAIALLRELGGVERISVPVLVMTGVTEPRAGSRVIQAGAQDLIDKGSINPETLTRAVENAVERHALICARRAAEEALRVSELRFRALFESTRDAITLIGPQGFYECNPAALALTGCASEEALRGKRPADFSPPTQPDGRESAALAEAHMATAYRNGSHRFEWRYLAPDGSERDADILVTRIDLPGDTLLQSSARDITERNQMARQLTEAEERLRFAMDATHDGIWDWDIPRGSVYFSQGFAQMLGYEPEELAPTFDTALSLLHLDDRDRVIAEVRRALADAGTFELEFRMCAKDGSERWILSRGKTVKRGPAGEPIRAVGTHMDLTQRQAMQRRLQESERRLSLALEAAGAGTWEMFPASGDFIASPRALALHGLAEGTRLNHQTALAMIAAIDQPKVAAALQQTLETGVPFRVEYQVEMGAEAPRWLASFAELVHDHESPYLIGMVRDVTERRLADDKLRDSEYRFRTLFDLSGDALLIIDNGLWSDCNAAAVSLFGCATREQLLGRSPTDFSPRFQPDGRETRVVAQEAMDTVLRTGEHRFDCLCRRLDGTDFPTEIQATRMRLRDHQMIQVTVRDISARQAMLSELTAASHAAEAANQAKSLFLANMSHEIRTPMNAILGLAYLLERQDLPRDARELARKIHRSGQNLLGLLNDILDLSKIESGQLQIERTSFRLTTVLENLEGLMSSFAREKTLALIIAAPACGDWSLRGDPLRLGQVLINLTNNAIKFTASGRVEVGIHPVERGETQVRLRFTVQDTGIGIDAETQARLFQPFSQADVSTTRRYGGTGLGLVISRRLVEIMGGRIGLESAPGAGSLFWFEMPFERAPAGVPEDQDSARTRVAPRPAASSRRLDGLRLLVVDDSDINREVASRIFAEEGAQVELAENGQAALEWLIEHPRDIDLVLMDVQMPVMDGHETTRRIRQTPGIAGLPVVALTAGAMGAQLIAAQKAGMDAFIPKPFDVEQAVAVMLSLAPPRSGFGASEETVMQQAPVSRETEAAFPGLALAHALTLWKDPEVYRHYLRKLAREYRDVARLIADTAPRDARQLAHQLKGAAGNLGLSEVAARAGELEQALATAKPSEASTPAIALATTALQAALQTALDSIERYAPAQPAPEAAHRQAENAERPFDGVGPLIRSALHAFQDFDSVGAEPSVSALSHLLPSELVAPLRQAVEDFDATGGEVAARALAAALGIRLEPPA